MENGLMNIGKLNRYKANISELSGIPLPRLEKFIQGYDNLNHKEKTLVLILLEEL